MLEQEGEDKDSCPKCNKYVRKGLKCEVCDSWIHYKCEKQVKETYIQTKSHTYEVRIGSKLRRK